MANGVNKVILIGNLGADPEVRYTSSGGAVGNFSLATNESWTDKNGQKQERTEWHRIVVWGKTAENCGQYLSKGRQAYIEGRLQTRDWMDKEGNKRYTTEVVAQSVRFLGGPSAEKSLGSDFAPPANNNFTPGAESTSVPESASVPESVSRTDDEVPF